MTVAQLLRSVSFVVDQVGKSTRAMVDRDMRQALLAALGYVGDDQLI